MASLIYNAAVRFSAIGSIDFDTDTFYVMLVTSTYSPNKDTHDYRDDVTNEVSGTGYTAGGQSVTCTVSSVDTSNDRVTLTFAQTTWSTATITARAAVYYKRRGGASSADELVAYNDFGSDYTSTAGNFVVAASVITLQN